MYIFKYAKCGVLWTTLQYICYFLFCLKNAKSGTLQLFKIQTGIFSNFAVYKIAKCGVCKQCNLIKIRWKF